MTDDGIVDPHQHFWDLRRNHYPWLTDRPVAGFRYGDYSAIKRDYLPDDFRRDAANQHVVKTVHVEAEWDPGDPVGETRWLQELANTHGLPTAAVGQAWFGRDDIADVLAGHAEYPVVRSIRQKPAAAPSPDRVEKDAPGSMGDPKWRDGYALLADFGLSYDLQTPWWHLYEAADLAETYPDTRIILNHTGLPADRSAEGLAGWHAAMAALAEAPNAVVKVSGLGQPGQPWTADGNRRVVRETIELFGTDRCMFASNFPVDSLVASYDTIFDGFKAIVADLPTTDRRKLFHDNAVRYYRLND